MTVIPLTQRGFRHGKLYTLRADILLCGYFLWRLIEQARGYPDDSVQKIIFGRGQLQQTGSLSARSRANHDAGVERGHEVLAERGPTTSSCRMFSFPTRDQPTAAPRQMASALSHHLTSVDMSPDCSVLFASR